MLTVKTSIRKSEIQGNGLFAEEDIPKDKVIWTFLPNFDRVYTEDEIRALPEIAREYMKHYTYQINGKIIFSADNDRFTNHSDDANTTVLPNGDFVAVRDIPRGSEMTVNYNIFDEGCDTV